MSWNSSIRFPFIALVMVGAVWMAPMLHTMLAFAVISFVAGLVMAAVVFDRDMELAPPLSEPGSGRTTILPGAKRALIIGAGTVGQTLAEHLEADGKYQVIGFVDDILVPLGRNFPPGLGGRDMT